TLAGERECLLTDLLLSVADLGGSKTEVEENRRLHWTKSKVQDDLDHTWRELRAPEARADALARITRKLIEKGEGNRSRPWPAQAGGRTGPGRPVAGGKADRSCDCRWLR